MTGCSTIIWGVDGGRIVRTTEDLIISQQNGEKPVVDPCHGYDPDFGEALQWAGLEAGEPEREDSTEGAWMINLENSVPARPFPSVVRYHSSESGMCIREIIWQ